MNISITSANKKDYLGFVEVFKEIQEFHRKQAPWKFKKTEQDVFDKEYHKDYVDILTDPDSKILLAKDSEHTIGLIVAFKKIAKVIPALQPRKWIEIDALIVQEKYKKQGIGKLLLQKIEDRAKENNIMDMQLNVLGGNDGAIKFYEKSGYTIISRTMRKVIE